MLSALAFWYLANGFFVSLMETRKMSYIGLVVFILFWPLEIVMEMQGRKEGVWDFMIYLASFASAMCLIIAIGALVEWAGSNDIFGVMK